MLREGKASVKGKGPKGNGTGLKGGCHECGGDHYVRDCRVTQERKGNGKGWWTIDSKNVQPRSWSSWNPGVIPTQWSCWRPGTKGSGKGKGFPGGKGDGNVSMLDFSKLSLPPLCAVSHQGGAADQGCVSLGQWACVPCWRHRAGIMAGYALGDQKQEEKAVHKDDWF